MNREELISAIESMTVLELAERILSAAGPLSAEQRDRLREVSAILERDRAEAGEETALRVVSRGAGSSVAEAAAEISRTAKRRGRRPTRTERAQ